VRSAATAFDLKQSAGDASRVRGELARPFVPKPAARIWVSRTNCEIKRCTTECAKITREFLVP
jgi:hypothetical protein